MRPIFFILVCFVLSVDNLLSQGINPSISSTSNPRVGITVLADGKPVTRQAGLKINAKHIVFKALLDTKNNDHFADFKPELLIRNMEVILARDSRKIAKVEIEDGQLPDKLIGEAKPEDRLVFKFTLVAQKKDGTLLSLSEEPIYNFILQK